MSYLAVIPTRCSAEPATPELPPDWSSHIFHTAKYTPALAVVPKLVPKVFAFQAPP